MRERAIVFEGVHKSYPLYHHITGGFKNFLFNFPKSITQFMNTRYDVLKGVSFEVLRGETFGIIGKNGAGKSTTLGLIAGVLKPTSGAVAVRGRVSPLLELGAGFNPELTGRENIVLNGVLMGLTRAEVVRRIGEIIEFSELGNFIDQPIRMYSSGMLARLGFSVVALLNPEILLIDEVLAVGDAAFQSKCLSKMVQFKKNGVTMIFVSHSLKDVEEICDRAVWIDNQRIRMLGPAREVVNGYKRAF